MRTIVSSYLDVTHDFVQSKNRYKALLRSRGLPATGKGIYTDVDLLKIIDRVHDHFVAANTFEQIRLQQEIKDSYEDKFAELARQLPVVKKLATIPGISNIRGAIITAIICSASRFATKPNSGPMRSSYVTLTLAMGTFMALAKCSVVTNLKMYLWERRRTSCKGQVALGATMIACAAGVRLIAKPRKPLLVESRQLLSR